MTTKQRLELLLHQAADSNPGDYTGDTVSATIEGKLVEVQRSGYGRKVYGKRAVEFDAWVDGQKVMFWKGNKGRVLEVLFQRVSDAYIAEQKKSAEEFRKAQLQREAADELARREKQEREAPARELANELMAKVWNKMVTRYGKQFNNDELALFLRSTVPPDAE